MACGNFASSGVKSRAVGLCQMSALLGAGFALGFLTGCYWYICEFPSALDVCDERTRDVDFLRENAQELEEVALKLKASSGDPRVLLAVQRVIGQLDPRRALSAEEQLLRTAPSHAPGAAATTAAPVVTSADACGEEFKGGSFGLPYFQKGFVRAADCRPEDKPALETLVTALLLAAPVTGADDGSVPPPDAPLAALRRSHPRLPVVAAVSGRKPANPLEMTVEYAAKRAFEAPGALLNRLVAKARTPYVLLVRDAVRVDELARLERLVFVVSALNGNNGGGSVLAGGGGGAGAGVHGKWGVAVAGGAVRDSQGRWSAGCAQTLLRNYALRFKPGYRYSVLDCMLCDTLRGPFLARTSLLREVTFDERLPAAVVFEDWFLRVKRRGALAAGCPDALFFVGGAAEGALGGSVGAGGGRENRTAWRQMAAAWQVDRVLLPGRQPLRFACDEVHLSCDLKALHKKGLLTPSCCLAEVANALSDFENFATRHKLEYELNAGTALGAAKLQNVLPWDIDADILIKFSDYDKYKAKKHEMSALGYSFTAFTENKQFKYFYFYTPHVSIDMWCRHKLSTFILPKEMQSVPTRMKIMGIWMRGPWNPGLLVRNLYGPGYLKHAPHWTRLGLKSDNDLYIVGLWGNCSLPYHHACLNRYPTEGSFNLLPEDSP